MNLHILPASLEHAHLISALGIITFYESYAHVNTNEDLLHYTHKSFHQELIQQELQSPETLYYIAFDDKLPIGYLKLNFASPPELYIAEPHLELQRIYVLRTYHQRSVGAALLRQAVHTAQLHHRQKIWLGVWKENHKALDFYFAKNFEILGNRSFQVGQKKYEDYILGLNID